MELILYLSLAETSPRLSGFLSLRVLIFSTKYVIYRSQDITLHYNESYDIKHAIQISKNKIYLVPYGQILYHVVI